MDKWRDVTYGRIVINYRPEKYDLYSFRLTGGGERIICSWDCGSPTVDMLTVKLILNSIVLTTDESFVTIDIKDLYLSMPIPRYKYMRLKLSDLPDNVFRQYNLREKLTKDRYFYTEI